MSAWGAPLRLARREAWRNKGRSLLVVVMIGLPVAAVTFAAVGFRTFEESASQSVTTRVGTVADGWVSLPGDRALAQTPAGFDSKTAQPGRRLPQPLPTIDAVLPAGSQWIPDNSRYPGGAVTATTTDASTSPWIHELSYDDPLAAGLVTQLTGRAPSGPHEVVVTAPLADTLSVSAGDTVTVSSGKTARAYTVVGTVRFNFDFNGEHLVGDPGAFPHVRFGIDPFNSVGAGYLVAVQGGLDYELWQQLNGSGMAVESREVAMNPPQCQEIPAAARAVSCDAGPTVMSPEAKRALAQTVGLVALVLTIGLLEVVLLVGPAFAIGRRRQTHNLALIAAVGGDARAVRRVVLSGGLVLGFAGGIAGSVLGLATFQTLRPVLSSIAGHVLFPTDLHPELLVFLVVATATGLAAAWLPARQASRQDVVAALSGRRGAAANPRTIPVVGAIAVVLGFLIAVFGVGPGTTVLLLLGCVIAELGLVALTPTLVGWLSRGAPHFPTAPRLALRDAGRNRLRAGTAAAAVLAAVAGATAVAVNVASTSANTERHYVPDVPIGYVQVRDERGMWPTPGPDISAALASLPVESTALIRGPRDCTTDRCAEWKVQSPVSTKCVADAAQAYTWPCSWQGGGWRVGDVSVYQALTGHKASAAVAGTLSSGGVVAIGDGVHYVDGSGDLTFRSRAEDTTVKLPATTTASRVVADGGLSYLFSPDAFAKLGLPARNEAVTVITSRPPTPAELGSARAALDDVVSGATLTLGEPLDTHDDLTIMILLAAAIFLAVAATATAVGLANADSRPDLATLAAIGAEPRTRRWMSASSAAVVAGTGTALGVAGGLVIGIASVHSTIDPQAYDGSALPIPLALPLAQLATLAVVVPLTATALSWLCTRSRLPMVQRID